MSVTRRQLVWVAKLISAIEDVERGGDAYIAGPIVLAQGDDAGHLGQLVQVDDVWQFTTEPPR